MANLSKIVGLLKKTGDKAIILDESGEAGYVIMTLADYERLVLGRSEVEGLTEDELLAKINRDIAIWKDNRESIKIQDLPIEQRDFSLNLDENGIEQDDLNPIENRPENQWELRGEDADRYYFEPVE